MHRVGRQIAIPTGRTTFRRHLAERSQHESTLGVTRVRHGQVAALDHHVIEEQQVEVEGARSPVHVAHPAGVGLDAMQPAQQRVGVEFGLDLGHHVEIGALILGAADRIGLEHLRLPNQRFPEPFDREPQMARAVTEVGAESDDRPVGGQSRQRRAHPMDSNGRRLNVDGDRRTQLREREIDRGHPGELENGLGHPLGEPLEQLVARRPSHLREAQAHLAVVHRFGEVVREPGVVQIDVHLDVDAKWLRGLTFVFEHAHHAHHAQTVDDDPIAGHGRHGTGER